MYPRNSLRFSKFLFSLFCVTAFCSVWYFLSQEEQPRSRRCVDDEIGPWQNQGRFCYKEDSSIILFFHLTNDSIWTPTRACAFRLAALRNNDTGVCVLSSFPIKGNPHLRSLPNLEISPLNFQKIFRGTPLDDWYETYVLNKQERGEFWIWELSDALRYAYLSKYGGKYMDTDSWTLRNLASIQNAAGLEDEKTIANGVLFFERGHPFLDEVLGNFEKYFSKVKFGSTGPNLVTKVHEMGRVNRSTYQILPPHYFYPINYQKNHYAIKERYTELVKESAKHSYAFHLWGFLIRELRDRPQNGSYVDEMLNSFCPC